MMSRSRTAEPEERNPFSLGIPIVLAVAAVVAITKLLSNSDQSILKSKIVAKTPSTPLPAPNIVAVVPAGRGVVEPPDELKTWAKSVKTSAEDACVIWVRMDNPQPGPLYGAAYDGDSKDPVSAEYTPFRSGIMAITVKRGYAVLPQSIQITTTRSDGRTTARAIVPGNQLPEPKRAMQPVTKGDPDVFASFSELRGMLFVKVVAKDPRTQTIAVRARRVTFANLDQDKWGFLGRQKGVNVFSGYVEVPFPESTRDLDLEIVEQVFRTKESDVAFETANVSKATAHRTVRFPKPEARAGPAGSVLMLDEIQAAPAPHRKISKPWGWFNTKIIALVKPVDPTDPTENFPKLRVEIVSPPASELNVPPLNYTAALSTEPLDEGQAAPKVLAAMAQHAKGALILRVKAVWRETILRRNVILTVRPVREPRATSSQKLPSPHP